MRPLYKWILALAISLLIFTCTITWEDTASGQERPSQEYRLYDQQSRPEGVIKGSDPNTYQIYDNQSKRLGTIYVHPDGSVDSYRPDGTRIHPTIRPSQPYQSTPTPRSRR